MSRTCRGKSQDRRARAQFRDVVDGARAPEHADMPIILQDQRRRFIIRASRLEQKQRPGFDLGATDHQRTGVAVHPDRGYRGALA